MRRIGFRSEFIDPIVSGSKTTTIRPAMGPLPRPGEVVGMRCRYDRPPFAFAQITSVTPFDPDSVSDRAARADGHPDAISLRASLRQTYGRRRLVSIAFQLCDEPEDPPTLFDR